MHCLDEAGSLSDSFLISCVLRLRASIPLKMGPAHDMRTYFSVSKMDFTIAHCNYQGKMNDV